MNALLELRKQMEVEFLKTKTYEEINDMFNQLNDKLRLAEIELKKLRVGDVIKNEVAVCVGCGKEIPEEPRTSNCCDECWLTN